MKLSHIKEPRLAFAEGTHVCPRRGIATYGVYDRHSQTRRTPIHLGVVGISADLEAMANLLERIKSPIRGVSDERKRNLFPDFCGFNSGTGFYAELVFNQDLGRPIKNTDLSKITKIENRAERIEAALDLYYSEIKFLAQNRPIDVIVCVLSKPIYDAVSKEAVIEEEEQLETSVEVDSELNFRRALKARTMHFGKPLQLLRAETFRSDAKKQQDDATKAWNLSTALYYKAGATNPWRLDREGDHPLSCALGVAFYRSRDKKSINTSLAQVFDELGNGLIMRGTTVQLDKDDRVPKLGVPGKFCTSLIERNWNRRSDGWARRRSIHLSRS